MTEGVPSTRCGYIWPEGHEVDDDPNHQSCCYRKVWSDTDRCIWHADSETVIDKPIGALRAARAPVEIRELNAPVTELLDGVEMSNQDLGDELSFHGVNLRTSTFSEAELDGVDFSNANLEGTFHGDSSDFSGADLTKADLSGAQVRYTKFSDANFHSANISELGLSKRYHVDKLSNTPPKWHANVDFTDADMTDIDASDAVLWRANFSGADLTNATFVGAQIPQSYLEDTILHHTSLENVDLRCSDFTDASVMQTDFSEASLGGSDLSTARLEKNNYSHTTLFGAELPDTFQKENDSMYLNISDLVHKDQLSRRAKRHLSNTYLPDAKFSEYSLTNANLSGAFLQRARIGRAHNADFTGASLRDADLSEPLDSGYARLDKTGCDFRGANLNNADLSETTLSETDFRHAILTDANFSQSTLTDADFSGAYLLGATFIDARLTDSDFIDASYHANPNREHRVNFSGAEIDGADFSEAELPKADFSEVCQRNRIESSPRFAEASLYEADFSDGNLTDADFTNAEVIQASFEGAYLNDADLLSADISWSDFTEAPLFCADLSDANLTGADLSRVWAGETDDTTAADISGATLEDATLLDAHLMGVDFTGARCKDAEFNDANLEQATFDDAVLREGSLIGADCEKASFRDAVLVRVSMEGADLVGTNLTGAYLFGAVVNGARIDTETQFAADGGIGDHTVAHQIRYDTDAPPDTPEKSLAAELPELEGAPENLLTIQLRQAASVYRRLEDLARQNGYPTLQSTMFKRRQEMRRQLLRQNGERRDWLFAEVQRWIFVYGESFSRVLSISTLVIGLFWLVYLITGTVEQSDETAVTIQAITEHPPLIITSLFHSVSVFFTGDPLLEATGRVGEYVMVIESMTGPILLALLVFVLGRRAAR